MTATRRLIAMAACVGSMCSFAGPTWAVDGVVLIDQNKALAGNVTPGDAAGFPITISQAGSYRLTSNLVVPDANTSAIVIGSRIVGVTIDLNGFAIIGPGVSGTGSGIKTTPDDPSLAFSFTSSAGITVQDGTIMGMGSQGVELFSSANVVENVTVLRNGGIGIFVNVATVRRNRAYRNGGTGIQASNSLVTDNVVTGNGGAGISGNDNLVVNNVLTVNTSVGVAAANSGFASNVFSSNNGSFLNPQFSGPAAFGKNLCDGTVCP